MQEATTITKTELPWRDCECGCKGMTLTLARQQLLRVYTGEGKFDLYRGHRSKARIGHSLSREQATALAIAHLRPLYDEAKREVASFAQFFE